MKDVSRSVEGRRRTHCVRDGGSAAGWAISVLSAILLGLVVFVALTYMGSENDGTVTPNPTSPSSSASPSPVPSETPTPEAGPFDGTWTGHVTGDLHLYTPRMLS